MSKKFKKKFENEKNYFIIFHEEGGGGNFNREDLKHYIVPKIN